MQQDKKEIETKNNENEQNIVETTANDLEAENKEAQGKSNEEKTSKPKRYSAIYLANIVCLPGINLTCEIHNEIEAQGIKDAFNKGEQVVLVASKDIGDDVKPEDIYEVGCLAAIKRVAYSGDVLKVMLVGDARVKISNIQTLPNFNLEAEILQDQNVFSSKSITLMEEIRATLSRIVHERNTPPSVRACLVKTDITPADFSDALVHFLAENDITTQAEMLLETNVEKRLQTILELSAELAYKLDIKKEIDEKVNANIQKAQKEMFLREQMNVISKELNGEADEIQEFIKKVKDLKLPKESEEKVIKEINRMSKLPFGSPELGYIRNFVETVIELPWNNKTDDNIDIKKAKEILDNEHYALEDIKARILETLAVIKLTKQVNAQIICLAGPPGVGKTSIAKSIANAMGRKYVQVSLGGVNDESVIRGHRRTYVGAMCGRILAGMKQAGTINPVFLLDEIDKMTSDARGDPASALLEVLDPAQNDHFKDNFLELPYDLSQVMFILTANDESKIPYALRDRMEIINLRAYTEYEKMEIAKNYLLPKQEKLAGIPENTVKLSDELIRQIIREYTFEGGVRSLERQIAKICRKYATFIVTGEKFKDISKENIENYLGKERREELDIYHSGKVGEVTGLAVFGDITGNTLLIEATLAPGEAGIKLTGKPGKAMKESVEQVYTLIKSRAKEWGIDEEKLNKNTIHVHIPLAGNGVEGPSAGTAMTTAVVSALTNIPTTQNIALTGEISIRGKVLPVGGVRDKLIAADSVGVKLCIIPKANEKDLYLLPDEVKQRLTIKAVSTIDEVLDIALQQKLKDHKAQKQDD